MTATCGFELTENRIVGGLTIGSIDWLGQLRLLRTLSFQQVERTSTGISPKPSVEMEESLVIPNHYVPRGISGVITE